MNDPFSIQDFRVTDGNGVKLKDHPTQLKKDLDEDGLKAFVQKDAER